MTAFQAAMISAEADATVDMLDEQGIDPAVEARIVPAGLVGTASDGRDLGSLLTIPDLTEAQFQRIVATQLQDVARQAASLERAVRPQVTAYVRVVNLPACGRCIILAGTPSRSQVAFDRHPQCDCGTAPTTSDAAEGLAADPRRAFEAMSTAEREKAFTQAGAEAIDLGADPAQVVNARRGMTAAQTPSGRRVAVRDRQGVYTTREGTWTSKRGRTRGKAARAMRDHGTRGPRLMPESIAELASTPAEHMRLLRAYGYIL